jgi:hypothetical protein
MDHVAILTPSRRLLPKILSGEKTIESRWYKARFAPWNRIAAGDTVYFKDSGKPITAAAEVARVFQLDHPSPSELRNVLAHHRGNPGICMEGTLAECTAWAKPRPYVILVFLKRPRSIAPLAIDKSGFGNSCAWLSVQDIRSITRPA